MQGAVTHPTAAAVVEAGGDSLRTNYGDLARDATALATVLQQLGVGPTAQVGVLLGRSYSAVVALLGTMLAGAAYVAIDVGYPGDRQCMSVHEHQHGARGQTFFMDKLQLQSWIEPQSGTKQ